jgi:hypothetical protein
VVVAYLTGISEDMFGKISWSRNRKVKKDVGKNGLEGIQRRSENRIIGPAYLHTISPWSGWNST